MHLTTESQDTLNKKYSAEIRSKQIMVIKNSKSSCQ